MSYEQSETIGELAKALVVFHKAVGKIGKNSNNPFFKSKYASLEDILDVIAEPLTEAGLVVVQVPIENNGLCTQVFHSSGEWIRGTYFMAPVKNDPQGQGSAITYQRRYAIAGLLNLNLGEDDDGNSASGHNAPQRPTTPHQEFHQQLAEAKASVKYNDLQEGMNETTFDLITEGSYNGKVYLTVKTPLGDVRAYASDTDPEFIHQVASLEGQSVRFLCGKSAKGSLYIKQIL